MPRKPGATSSPAAQILFTTRSPLVMFNARNGADIDTALLKAWRDHGYDLYRLIGPDTLLVPVGRGRRADGHFEINLFACKPDRAAKLEAAGLLATGARRAASILPGSGFNWRKQVFAQRLRSDQPHLRAAAGEGAGPLCVLARRNPSAGSALILR